MTEKGHDPTPRWRLLRTVLVTSLMAGTLTQLPASPATAAAATPTDVKGIKVTPVVATKLPEYTAADRELTEADLPPDSEVQAQEQVVNLTTQTGARKQAETSPPVSVTPVTMTHAAARASARSGSAVDKVNIRAMTGAGAAKMGATGLAIKIARADGVKRTGRVRLAVDYKSVAGHFNREALSRLRLIKLDDGQPVPSENDPVSGVVTASVSVAATGSASTFALAAAPEGENGDYKATSLTPASTWQVSQQNGAFSWSYPIKSPSPPAGIRPDLTLNYSSASIDGRTSGNNTQGSWIGDGWSLEPGFIERTYRSCTEDKDEQDGKGPNNKDAFAGDQCWFDDNATMSFNGSATELVKVASSEDDADSTTVLYRGKADDGSRIEQIKGERANGDEDKIYWRVTTVDGTQYFFGRGTTDGGTSSGADTKSTWTAPVYSNHPGEPGHDDEFSKSRKDRAWRWNLDYAIDPSGNTVTYFYAKEQGAYGREGDKDKRTTYDRGGYLTKVEYGSRSTATASTRPVNRILFDTADRCIGTCFTSAGKPIAKRFPDAPWDQYCDTAPCSVAQLSPTFWTAKRLAKITTQVYSGSGDTYTPVDTYTLEHAYLQAGGNESTPMWLKKITHTGNVTTAGGPAVTDPPAVFNPNADVMPNRVDTPNGHSSLFRNRIQSITTESGGQIGITYSKPECDGITLPKPWANTKRCFPQYYAAEGEDDKIDWFNKYVVTRVDVYDNTGGFEHEQTNYDYLDSPAWAYNSSPLVKPKKRTWGDFRGYGRVLIRTGTDDETQTRTEYRYYRGMDGDPQPKDDGALPPKGTPRSVQVKDSLGGEVDDHEAIAGMLREQINYNGSDWISGTLNTPAVQGPLATSGPLKSWRTHAGTERQRTKLSTGATRWTAKVTTVNADHQINAIHDMGDEAVATDDRCTRMEYARNESAWMLDRVKRKVIDGVGCGSASSPATVLSDIRTYYDNADTYGAVPSRGLSVRQEQVARFDNGQPVLISAGRTGYDELGRTTSQTDARGNITRTEYTPALGGPITQTKVTDPLKNTVTNTLNPALGVGVKVTDTNGLVTESAYDGNARLLKVWAPGRARATYPNDPSVSYTYNLSKTAPSSVITRHLMPAGTKYYRTTVALYDGMLRLRQTQTQTIAGGRAIVDSVYNSRGLLAWSSSPYYDIDNTAPNTTLVTPVRRPEIPALTANVYDGAGRITDAIFTVNGNEAWRQHTAYTGERTSVTPPRGGTATTTITDARGKPAELRQYNDPAKVGSDDPATFDRTTYRYTNRDEIASVTGPGNNTWSYGYDLRGHQTTTNDPDAGTSTSEYDDLGRLSWTKDARGKAIHYKYDVLGRKIAEYQGTANGRKLAEWTYDTLAMGKGKLTSSTRYEYDSTGKASAYVTATAGYDTAGRPKGTAVTIPSTDSGLCVSGETNPCTFTQTFGYRPNGALEKVTTPAVAGLPPETVTNLFNEIGLPHGLLGNQIYAQEVIYNQLDQLIGQNLGEHGARVALSYGYDDTTGRKSWFNAIPELKTDIYNLRYGYSNAGNVTSITDTPDAGQPAETQCFQYDALERLTQAWAQASSTCAATPTRTTMGGPAAYWRSYTYDQAGNRKTETIHQTTDTTRAYDYPASGGGAGSKPHAVTKVTTTGTSSVVHQYAYDASGNTLCRPTGIAANVCNANGTSGTASQTLTWNDYGNLSTSSDTAGVTSFTYDTSGARLIRRDPTGATLYLPGGLEIRKPKSGNAVGTRYYTFAGSTIAVRTATALTWLINDHQGSATATVASTSALTVNRRRTTPFGEDRGTKPTAWAGDKGFIGGTRDNTGLTHLGAREYDPTLGRFISVDPVMDFANPHTWSAYNYADDNPVTTSDPSGLCPQDRCDGYGKSPQPAPVSEPTQPSGDNGGGGNGGNGGGGNGGNGGGGNSGGSTGGNVATQVPVVIHEEPKCTPEWYCKGWDNIADFVGQNADTLIDISVDVAEITGGALLAAGGSALAAGGGVVVVGSGGILTVVGAPAVALGVAAIGAGGGLAVDGANKLGKDARSLQWNNEASEGVGAGRAASGSLEGKRDYVVNDPKNAADTITDIDHVENGILWEEKSATSAGNTQKWVDKHVTKKLNSYVRARSHLPGYESAPIGIRFTTSGVDSNFRSAVEGAVGKFKEANPGVDVRLEFPE